MKTLKAIILIAAMGMLTYSAAAQKNNNVPQGVETAFNSQFPQAHLQNWKLENGQYMASFKLNKRECQATYANDGAWLSTETTFRRVTKHVTPELKYALRNSRYASYHIDLVQDLQTPTRNMYLLQVDNHSGSPNDYEDEGLVDDQILYFSHNGKLIKSVDNN